MSGDSKLLQLRAAPGFIVGRLRQRDERTPGGLFLPDRSREGLLPIVKVIDDGGPPRRWHGEEESRFSAAPEGLEGFRIEAGKEVVVRGADQLLRFGTEELVLVAYEHILAEVHWLTP